MKVFLSIVVSVNYTLKKDKNWSRPTERRKSIIWRWVFLRHHVIRKNCDTTFDQYWRTFLGDHIFYKLEGTFAQSVELLLLAFETRCFIVYTGYLNFLCTEQGSALISGRLKATVDLLSTQLWTLLIKAHRFQNWWPVPKTLVRHLLWNKVSIKICISEMHAVSSDQSDERSDGWERNLLIWYSFLNALRILRCLCRPICSKEWGDVLKNNSGRNALILLLQIWSRLCKEDLSSADNRSFQLREVDPL